MGSRATSQGLRGLRVPRERLALQDLQGCQGGRGRQGEMARMGCQVPSAPWAGMELPDTTARTELQECQDERENLDDLGQTASKGLPVNRLQPMVLPGSQGLLVHAGILVPPDRWATSEREERWGTGADLDETVTRACLGKRE